MKIELKNFKFYPRLSEETNAFSATIYVNGKKAGECSNNGHGGCAEYHFDDPKIRDEVETYVDSLPDDKWTHDGEEYSRKLGTYDYFDDMAGKIIEKKESDRIHKLALKEKAGFLARGFSVTLQIDKGFQVVWVGLKSLDGLEKARVTLSERYKVAPGKITVVS